MKQLIPLMVALPLAIALAQGPTRSAGVTPFAHEDHDGYFPLCTTCHAGITSSDQTAWYPQFEQCQLCHDGERADGDIAWTRPQPPSGFLRFSHEEHLEMTEDCAECHGDGSGEFKIIAFPAGPDGCFDCHDSSHLDAENDCTTCHQPLTTAAGLSVADIAAFPRPEDHEQPGFGQAHGPLAMDSVARCATCHARESCERCHLSSQSLEPVQSLQPDPRVAELMKDRAEADAVKRR